MGCIPPKKGFLEELRLLCDKHNILLLFDEVMTGFRLAQGGAQELYGIQADIVMFGKVIGGGLPVGAFVAREEIMNHLAPDGPVYQAGTLSGNPLAMAAGLAMLTHLNKNPEIYNLLNEKTAYLETGLHRVFKQNKVAHTINRVGSMLSVHFTEKPVVNFDSASQAAKGTTFKTYFHGLLKQGIYIAPSAYETWFICNALSYDDLDKTIAVSNDIAKKL